jgi:hypothetical protein
MAHVPLSLLASWVLHLWRLGCCLSRSFPVVAQRCLVCPVLLIRSVMTRSPFFVYLSCALNDFRIMLRPPSQQTELMKFPFRIAHPRSALVSCDRNDDVLLTRPTFSCAPSISRPFLRPQPTLKAPGRGQCPLGYGLYRFVSSSSSSLSSSSCSSSSCLGQQNVPLSVAVCSSCAQHTPFSIDS